MEYSYNLFHFEPITRVENFCLMGFLRALESHNNHSLPVDAYCIT